VNKHIITVLIATTLLAACGKKEQAPEENKKFVLSDSMQHLIKLDTVQYCNIADELSLTGEVSFNENNVVKIFPRSSGQVVESRVSLGDKVTKGQVLAVIRSADIAGNYSDLNSANADVTIAKRQMDNAESLFKNGISSEREYIEAKQNYEKALAARNKIQSVITINGGGRTSEAGQYTLVAPISGYIVEKKIATGAFIRPDMGDNLFTISDLKNVWIYANVYESDIPKVKAGYDAVVIPMAYPDKRYDAKIDEVSQVLDPQSKAMRVRVTLDNKDMLLKPDMFAKVIVSNREGSEATCIPTSAILSQDGKNYVVVYNSDSDMAITEIDIIKTVGEKTFIRSGVHTGQQLITQNQLFIFNQLLNE
jgi:cobalt-zinc-cadmium efflux system membrane fusion protein